MYIFVIFHLISSYYCRLPFVKSIVDLPRGVSMYGFVAKIACKLAVTAL